MTNHRAINVVAAVITVACGCWLFLLLRPAPPALDREPHVAVGEMLAAEAVKRLEPGARLIVIARDRATFRVPGSEAQLDAFLKALRQSNRHVTSFHWLKLDPLRLNAVPPGDFFDLLRQGRTNDVIVSFLGPPVLEPLQLAKLGAKRLQVLALCSGATPSPAELKRLFDQRLLTAAIICRHDVSPNSSDRRGVFEQGFKLITANNAQELLATAAPRE